MIEVGGRPVGAGPRASRARLPLPHRFVPIGAAVAAVGLLAAALPAGAASMARTVSAATAAEPLVIKPLALLARLQTRHPARDMPDPNGRVVAVVSRTRPLTGEQTVLPVLDQVKGSDGKWWLEVRLPGRPLRGQVLASTGWISQAGTRFALTPWHIVVNAERRRASVFKDGTMIRRFRVIVGKPSTPTPHGEFFVEENVRVPPRAVGAPYALATSARSSVFQAFAGGPGQIALHGLRNIGGKLGTAVSHGCVRFANSAITWLAARVPPGAPISIV
jgi:lipoprotein-anchoring transpeptidase ErfK/SrfK